MAYCLHINIGKNTYNLRALSYYDLFNKRIIINFKKSILISQPTISIYLSYMR
jgi:hypothetical protein